MLEHQPSASSSIYVFLLQILLYKAVIEVQFAKMPALESHYDIWEPASRLRPVLPPGTSDMAEQIKVCTRAKVCQHLVQDSLPNYESQLVQDTGSSMLAEDDLATLFGRYEIEAPVGIAFRKVVKTHSTQCQHSKDVYLRIGRGPTLERALAENGSFMFATVVQCAFLCLVCLHSLRTLGISLDTVELSIPISNVW